MTRPVALGLAWIGLAVAAPRGLPVRTSPADYAAHAEQSGAKMAAEVLSPDDVRNLFSTDLRNYIVVEVAVWPKEGGQLDVSGVDFGLKTDPGRAPVRPASARTIATINQKRSRSRTDDIVLYPSVGVTTGSWGTGTQVGVGVGMGGGAPGPASTGRDREVMEQELDERALPDVVATKPVAGYLFFPAAPKGRKSASYELIYDSEAGRLAASLPVPK